MIYPIYIEGIKNFKEKNHTISNFIQTDILQSSWCLEVHSNSWLSDLKLGEAAEILKTKYTIITEYAKTFSLYHALLPALLFKEN